MPRMEQGTDREQLRSGMKEKSRMLDFCYNAVRSYTQYSATSGLYAPQEERDVRSSGETVNDSDCRLNLPRSRHTTSDVGIAK